MADATQEPSGDENVREQLRAIEGEFIGDDEPRAQAEQEAETAQGAAAMDWTVPAGLLVMILDRMICPNWELEAGEKAMLHEQTTQTLQVCFPNIAMDPRIVAVLSLGGAFVAIAAKRIDPETGALKPMHAPKQEENEQQEAS